MADNKFYEILNVDGVKIKTTYDGKDVVMAIDNVIVARTDVDTLFDMRVPADEIYIIVPPAEAKQYADSLIEVDYNKFVDVFMPIKYKRIPLQKREIIRDKIKYILDYVREKGYAIYTL